MKKIFTSCALIVVVMLAVLASYAISSLKVGASSGNNVLGGWAWGDTTGWSQFDTNTPVTINGNSGALSGYVWSDYIGWISFYPADVGGCPSSPCAPTVDLSTGAVTGWAKALTGAGRTDGWDGWIELSGTNHTSPELGNPQITGSSGTTGGVTYDISNGAFRGYAWGGEFVGWLDMTARVSCSPSCGVTVTPPPAGTPINCIGTAPTPGAGESSGASQALATTTWTYMTPPVGTLAACQWTCLTGYHQNGNSCAADTNGTSTPGIGCPLPAPTNSVMCPSTGTSSASNILRDTQAQCTGGAASCEFYCPIVPDTDGNQVQLINKGTRCAFPSGTIEH